MPDEPSPEVAREAWGCFFGLMTSAANRRRMAGICDHFGITPGQMRSLVTMGPGPARPMKDLAVEWHCDASYVTVMVDDFESRGWVERQAHPGDRRSRVVALTPAGKEAREALLGRLGEPPPFFAALTDDEARTMRDLLRKLLAAAGGGTG
ncbi:MAG TPA: MarR family winged helix-turn-helix transcriptional regulator [Acidimicrobiales bacterium]